MLEGKFYSILSFHADANAAKAVVKLNRESHIFEGHFPQVPIVPGVCSLQMILELAEKAFNKKLRLVTGDNIKFLELINPDKNPEINLDLTFQTTDQNQIKTSATIWHNETTFLKFKGIFQC